MKKTVKYILFALILTVIGSCAQELEPINRTEDLPYPSEGKALVKMSVRIPGHVVPATRAFGDSPDSLGISTLRNMRVAVFGSSGFLKESVEITRSDFQAATDNGDETLCSFSVRLSLSDSKRLRVHVMANCTETFPWKYEDVVMGGSAFTSGEQDAYWCRFTLPNGITLKKEYNAETDAMEYVKVGGYYQVTDDVTDAFKGGKDDQGNYKGLPMLRNFAKVSVESTTPQLILDPVTTMAVINKPDCGSVAPYNPETGEFMNDYYLQTYDYLKENYPGFTPSGMTLIDSDPSASGLFKPCTVDGSGNVSGGIFMYERPIPQGDYVPTYILIHGVYYPLKEDLQYSDLPNNWKALEKATPGTYLDLSDASDCYYKVDLMDEDGYYAIFRNFRYHIRITNVSKKGSDTPAQAGSTGGTGDVSQSTEYSGFTDISDGYGRIAVSYMQMTFVEAKTQIELKYKFIPDVDAGDVPDNRLVSEGGDVSITIGEPTGPISVFSDTFDSSFASETGIEIGDSTTGKVKVITESDEDPYEDDEGYRTIKFTVNTPNTTSQTTQKVLINGRIGDYQNIYREVEFILMKKQDMTVTCIAENPHPDYESNSVENVIGEGVNVNITIPTQLPESMFPLLFNIESDLLSITPNTDYSDNLPVESGYSICENKENQKSFHYVRTLSYDEYKSIPDLGSKTITCHFKTNKAQSASTIYVSNEYFNKGSGAFLNHSLFHFRNLYFDNYRAAAGTNVTFHFELDPTDDTRTRTVRIQLEGLLPRQNNPTAPWGIIDVTDGVYSYDVGTGISAVDLQLKTPTGNNYSNNYSVTIIARDGDGKTVYQEAELLNMAYNSISIDAPSNNDGSFSSRTISSNPVSLTFSSLRRTRNGYMRANSNSTLTVSTSSSSIISKVIITYYNTTYVGGSPTVSVGEYSLNGTTGIWSGRETSPVITFTSEARITNVKVIYEVGN